VTGNTWDGIVLARTGGRYRVHTGRDTIEASLRGRMKQDDYDRVLVGDRVKVQVGEDGSATIEEIRPRKGLLKRRSPGRSRGERLIAANMDQVVVVGSARQPAWDTGLIDRFTAVAEANGIPPVLVINKCDLDPDAARHGDPYARAGYPVLITSAVTGGGLDELRERLTGNISLLTGPTGVGKSSLLNGLWPGLALRTKPVSHRTRTGRHTTVSAEMHAIGDDTFVVDTPGLRDIGLWGLDPLEVGRAFPDLLGFGDSCRFDNCRHREEPDCGVRAAVEADEASASRYRSYRALLEEAEQALRFWE
jgi:ribosome biogenesis GTPase / thiamine phosphate phosphatase